jgi:DNA-directed RNA polymerase specialized sigma24 family protein
MSTLTPLPPAPRADEAFVIRQADRRSNELVRRGRILPDDKEDFRQELILDILEQGHHFDPDRGTWPGFVCRLMRNRSETLTQLEQRRRRIERPTMAPDPDDFEQQAARKSVCATPLADSTFHGTTEISLVLSRLPDDLRTLADQLCWMELDEIARVRGVSKQWLHLLKRRLRRAFIAAGVMPPGWNPATDRRMKRSAW